MLAMFMVVDKFKKKHHQRIEMDQKKILLRTNQGIEKLEGEWVGGRLHGWAKCRLLSKSPPTSPH